MRDVSTPHQAKYLSLTGAALPSSGDLWLGHPPPPRGSRGALGATATGGPPATCRIAVSRFVASATSRWINVVRLVLLEQQLFQKAAHMRSIFSTTSLVAYYFERKG
jgi:hypothetical protein